MVHLNFLFLLVGNKLRAISMNISRYLPSLQLFLCGGRNLSITIEVWPGFYWNFYWRKHSLILCKYCSNTKYHGLENALTHITVTPRTAVAHTSISTTDWKLQSIAKKSKHHDLETAVTHRTRTPPNGDYSRTYSPNTTGWKLQKSTCTWFR